MQLRSRNITSAGESPAKTPFRWTSLPPEIRLMILEQLQRTKIPEQRTAPWCSVSSEWQAFFEKQNFESLKLTTLADIRLFKCLVRDRQRLVKQVWLHIMLETNRCGQCDEPEDARTIATNNQRFSRKLLEVLTVLSKLEATEGEKTGLTLKLSASSSSDIKHCFPRSDGSSCKQHIKCAQRWLFDKQGSKMRRIGSLLDFDAKVFTSQSHRQEQDEEGGQRLPATPIITRFVISRTSYRSLSAEALAKVLKSLTHLEHIRYQPWRGVEADDQELRDLSNIALLQNLPSALQSLSLWEYATSRFHHRFQKPADLAMDLALAAVVASQRLQEFSLTNAVDAVDFYLAAHAVEASWPDLKFLAITASAKALRDSHGSGLANDIFSAAGRAAMRMPQLEVLEIWSQTDDDGFRFNYKVLEGQTRLTIEALWNFRPSKDMLGMWRTVGTTHTRHELEMNLFTLSNKQVARKSGFQRRMRLRNLIDGT